MWLKLVRQTGICLIIIMTLALAEKIDHPQLNQGVEMVMGQLEKNYTANDVMTFAEKIKEAPTALTAGVRAIANEPRYGKPIDPVSAGEMTMVYAVEDGVVAAVGENHKIGKFIKILHKDGRESIYGNCQRLYVKELENVKKGQIIGTFQYDGKTEFYYSLSKLN